jgi:maltose O-acetyltransferase
LYAYKKVLGRVLYGVGGGLPHGTYNQFPISQVIRRVACKLLFDKAGRGINIGRKCRLSNHISMGDQSGIGDGTYISGNLNIGDYVMIAPQCVFIGLDHVFDEETLEHKGSESKPISIGDYVLIGYGVKVLSGVNIGEYSIVGAGAVVTKDVKPYSIVGGVPARLIRLRKH